MKLFIVGIDPGINGGIVSLVNNKIITITDMPSNFKGILEHFIFLGFPNMIKKEETYVYMENVHSRPTDSRVGAFSFGRHHGHLDSVFNSLDVTPILVSPQRWMEYFNIKRDKGESKYSYKKRLLEMGRLLARGTKFQLTLKTCDAYLIALYGYNQQLTKRKKSNEDSAL